VHRHNELSTEAASDPFDDRGYPDFWLFPAKPKPYEAELSH